MRNLAGRTTLSFIIPILFAFSSSQRPENSQEDRILFAVWAPQNGKEPYAYLLDPIARIRGSKLMSPIPNDGDSDGTWKQFEKRYLEKGRVYPLLFGGSQYASITVEKFEPISCESSTATAKVSKATPSGLNGLAVSSLNGMRVHDNWRHRASEDQKSGFVRLAAEFMKAHGAKPMALGELEVGSLRATKLGSGRPEVLIGSATLKEQRRVLDLFLVVEMKNEKPQILLTSYHEAKDPDDGVDRQEEKFLDQIDLDGDGVDEIVTLSGYYESWDYAIYKEQKGEWKRVYSGGGGGC